MTRRKMLAGLLKWSVRECDYTGYGETMVPVAVRALLRRREADCEQMRRWLAAWEKQRTPDA